jgi:hypothetical protein
LAKKFNVSEKTIKNDAKFAIELVNTRQEILAEKGKANMSKGGGDKVSRKAALSLSDKPAIEPVNTQKEIAEGLSIIMSTSNFYNKTMGAV